MWSSSMEIVVVLYAVVSVETQLPRAPLLERVESNFIQPTYLPYGCGVLSFRILFITFTSCYVVFAGRDPFLIIGRLCVVCILLQWERFVSYLFIICFPYLFLCVP